MKKILIKWFLLSSSFARAVVCLMVVYHALAYAAINEPVQACVIADDVDLTDAIRAKLARCLGWHSDKRDALCLGAYQPIRVNPLPEPNEIRIMADKVSFYQEKRSILRGRVEVQQNQRIINAQTAYIYRDSKNKQIIKIEFLGEVHYLEPDKLVIARKATINPQDKSTRAEGLLYRFNSHQKQGLLTAWGRAGLMQRLANADYVLDKATYSTCAPQDKAWDIKAKSITIDNKKAVGVARNVTVRVHEQPVFYLPYWSFPTNKHRKSGFLMPLLGYSNIGGFDLGFPYYVNSAANHDLTLTPQIYSQRGLMLASEFRYLTANSSGLIRGSFLPNDPAYRNFLNNHQEFPWLKDKTANRWSFGFLESTQFTPNLRLNVKFQEVSDDYYFQDLTTNWALITQRQLLRQGDLTYSTEHWTFKAMAQSYQTLHPLNEAAIADQYARLPQFLAHAYYDDLPMGTSLNLLGQYDQFFWPTKQAQGMVMPQGPRIYFNPEFSLPQRKAWGYLTPSIELVERYYQVQNKLRDRHTDFINFIPRYSIRGGLFFERNFNLMDNSYRQTLEPSLFYLRVPYQDQTKIPIYDTANMIFNVDQLFRTNRFSGFDRVADTNQLSYALSTRWLSEKTGAELAHFSIGQIKYFSARKVQLCASPTGFCSVNPYEIGQLSPIATTSPIASRVVYHFNPIWSLRADYVWDQKASATNNGNLNVHYQSAPHAVFNLGYTYLLNGDMTGVKNNTATNNALHQMMLSFSWPMNTRWNTIGAYSYNLSKQYNMMSLLGVEYNSCCWAIRVLGGKTFKSLDSGYVPHYTNNLYLQILLKGLGSIGNNAPGSLLNTYIPGYSDSQVGWV